MTSNNTAPTPADLVYSGSLDNCVYGHVDEAREGSVREAAHTSRAAAQREFASELGVDFGQVSCRTTYGRFLTRQDAWDDYGSDRWVERRLEELELEPRRDAATDVWFYEDPRGRRVPESDLEPPAEPPADWEPDDDDPVWTVCSKDAHGAIKIYVLEERV